VKRTLRQLTQLAALLLLEITPPCAPSSAQVSLDDPRSPLDLVRRISLLGVSGRVDHMAFDAGRDQLFVMEIGNGSVDDIDLASGTVAGRITVVL